MIHLDKDQYLNEINSFFLLYFSLKFILLRAISHRVPEKPLGHVHVPLIGLQTASFKHPRAQYVTKIFKSLLNFFSSIYLLRPVSKFEIHRSIIPPSGQIHPNVLSMIIQTPVSPQNECSQTAIKRRARNI
jgi:hypothetical protein